MTRNLGQKLGLYHLDLQHLLGSESDGNIPGYPETVRDHYLHHLESKTEKSHTRETIHVHERSMRHEQRNVCVIEC